MMVVGDFWVQLLKMYEILTGKFCGEISCQNHRYAKNVHGTFNAICTWYIHYYLYLVQPHQQQQSIPQNAKTHQAQPIIWGLAYFG
ncbi:hypothetical protein [Rossellomorea sp. LJF3]|uniref:hypothetical protein n=1 Tax=Rossellomorea sp. LJF3 TaxID=3126099 RepID=UPI00300C38D6